jgi:hypothetical protein
MASTEEQTFGHDRTFNKWYDLALIPKQDVYRRVNKRNILESQDKS